MSTGRADVVIVGAGLAGSAAARALVTEDTLGISSGHAEVRSFFERRLRALPKKRIEPASDADGD